MSRADYSLPLAVLVDAREAMEATLQCPPLNPLPFSVRDRLAASLGALEYWTERIARSVDVEATPSKTTD